MLVYIVLLNWKGARDTVACLESALRLTGVACRLVVCDNASPDDSVAVIRRWAAGVELTPTALGPLAGRLQPLPKPLRLAEYSRAQAESSKGPRQVADVHLIHTGANLGFAGGCNVGMRFALGDPDCSHIWLLNNDTVVEPEALQALLARATQPDHPGMVGSTLCLHDAPDLVQSLGGGTFAPWRSMSRHLEEGQRRRVLTSAQLQAVEQVMVYVVGASMLVSRAFVEQVGLMQEDYFLYFEEIDWAERGRRAVPPWTVAYAQDSIVYHKVGASAGTAQRSPVSLRYLTRNRLRVVKRFYPSWLGVARLWLGWEGLKALLKGRLGEAGLKLRTAVSPVRV